MTTEFVNNHRFSQKYYTFLNKLENKYILFIYSQNHLDIFISYNFTIEKYHMVEKNGF